MSHWEISLLPPHYSEKGKRWAPTRFPRTWMATRSTITKFFTRKRVRPDLPLECSQHRNHPHHPPGATGVCGHEGCEAPLIPAKRALPAWSPVLYRPEEPRSSKSAQKVTILALDFDDGTPIEEAREPFMDVPHIVHTSWSHTPDHPKFRLVVPLAEDVPAEQWPRCWYWAAQRAGQHPDPQCKDATRLYFVPAVPSEDSPFEVRVHWPHEEYLHLRPDELDPTPGELQAERVAKARESYLHAPRGGAPVMVPRETQARIDAKDPGWRAGLGEQLGGRISSGRVTKVVCPGCGRPSLWWWIEPDRQTRAYCDHRNSCGQSFGLWQLGGA